MRRQVRRELTTLVIYFLIALTAELAGFIGWVNEMTKGGDVFQITTAFWVYELSRLRVWLPVFLGLAALRILVVSLVNRSRGAE